MGPDNSIHDCSSFIDFHHSFLHLSKIIIYLFYEYYEVNDIYTVSEAAELSQFYSKSSLFKKIYESFTENSWDTLIFNYINFLSSKLQNWNFDIYRNVYATALSDQLV